jgi:hypothetical protein
MKLDVDVNEVVLSNVGSTGEFKIRNSAKAFKILSDGLYSNKIRAIVRELSCNAVDSHVAAGKKDVQFEVHLPNVLEPWFAVRDFGIGLDDHQVVNIYTTYFESTKTDSNDFIGALGLGSKSPFSYTENFTVTAIKDGMQRIYSAFINEQGIPSIARMSEEETTESNGVEVKFSVTNRSDYQSFRNEAADVFKWFEGKPKVVGADNFQHRVITYGEKNIVPGVHTLKNDNSYYDNYHQPSYALMGNICYPLNNIPDPKKSFGSVAELLGCGLVLEFGIGDLDFAASREQLSYIPQTLNSIKRKLEELNANLANHIAGKANVIDSEWERAFFLYEQGRTMIFKSACEKYAKDTNFALFDPKEYYGMTSFKYKIPDLADRGLEIHAFQARGGQTHKLGEHSEHTMVNSQTVYVKSRNIPVAKETIIVLNDLKTGCQARARYHYNSNRLNANVYCISHKSLDLAERQVEYDKILAELHNPPVVLKASELDKQVRAKPVSTQGIMCIRLKSNQRSGYEDSYTWTPYTEEIDEDETYYYVGLNNHQAIHLDGRPIDILNVKSLMDECGIADIKNINILGVRKSRIDEIQQLGNWVWAEEKIKEETAKISDKHIASLVVAEMLDSYYNKVYTNKKVAKLLQPDSEYAKYVSKYGSIERATGNITQLIALCGKYGKAVTVDAVKKDIEDTKSKLFKKYPFIKLLRDGADIKEEEVAKYINMVDKMEKI